MLGLTGKCESPLEEKLLWILQDYEIYSMVKGIHQQVWMFEGKYRVDFVLYINDTTGLVIEVDGSQHFVYDETVENIDYYCYKQYDVVRNDWLESLGYYVLHIPYWELNDRELVANRIEQAIDRLRA